MSEWFSSFFKLCPQAVAELDGLTLGEWLLTTEELDQLIERADGERFGRERRNDSRKYQPEVGREATMGPELIREWQNRRSVWTWTAAFLALASMVGTCVCRYAEVWAPLERFGSVRAAAYVRLNFRVSVADFAKLASFRAPF